MHFRSLHPPLPEVYVSPLWPHQIFFAAFMQAVHDILSHGISYLFEVLEFYEAALYGI
jgi:hypothetical protein